MQEQAAVVRLASLARLKGEDIDTLREMAGSLGRARAGSVLQHADVAVGDLLLLLDGWTFSCVTLKGGGRQIVKIHLPGDLIGMASLPFKRTVDAVVALTDVEFCTVSPAALGRLFSDNPRLASLLFLISLEERVTLVDRLSLLGRAETSQRIAALILQLRDRMMRTDPDVAASLRVPLTQTHIADMVGATTVHVSRVIQEMATGGLLKWERGRITILDLERLQAFAAAPSRELAKDPAWLPPG